MRALAKWVFVFVAGMYAYRTWLSSKHEISAVRSPVQSTDAPRAPAVEISRTPPIDQPKVSKAVPPVLKPKHTVHIDLSESKIAKLESEWIELPREAEAQREERGWRFTRLSHDSSFYQLGFREGDLVNKEFMDILRNSDAGLVIRMEHLLNRISR